jgi:hypothetical protein
MKLEDPTGHVAIAKIEGGLSDDVVVVTTATYTTITSTTAGGVTTTVTVPITSASTHSLTFQQRMNLAGVSGTSFNGGVPGSAATTTTTTTTSSGTNSPSITGGLWTTASGIAQVVWGATEIGTGGVAVAAAWEIPPVDVFGALAAADGSVEVYEGLSMEFQGAYEVGQATGQALLNWISGL